MLLLHKWNSLKVTVNTKNAKLLWNSFGKNSITKWFWLNGSSWPGFLSSWLTLIIFTIASLIYDELVLLLQVTWIIHLINNLICSLWVIWFVHIGCPGFSVLIWFVHNVSDLICTQYGWPCLFTVWMTFFVHSVNDLVCWLWMTSFAFNADNLCHFH